MDRETLRVMNGQTGFSENSQLLVTVRSLMSERCTVVIGWTGLPNSIHEMEVGDAALIETPSDGLFEIRVTQISFRGGFADVLLSRVSPRSGLLAGASDIDPDNAPFSQEELKLIASSFQTIKERATETMDLKPETLQLLMRKIDEVQAGASRMGRKDWINYVAGSLTSFCITAAFAPEQTTKLFTVVNTAFTWFFVHGVLLFR